MLSFNDLKNKEDFYKTISVFLGKVLFSPFKIRVQSFDCTPLVEYLNKPAKFFEAIRQDLLAQRFSFQPLLLKERIINEKPRKLFIAPWRDRLVDLFLYHQLDQRFNSDFSPISYAFRTTEKGLHRCIEELKN